jgi:hypothetical protein
MGRLSHLGSKRNSDVLLVVQDGAPAWKTSPASGVMLSVRYQAHSTASQWYAVSRLSSLEELESRSATHLRTNWRRDSRNDGYGMAACGTFRTSPSPCAMSVRRSRAEII